MAKLHEFYKETVVADLAKQFGYKSVMQVPRVEKITLNMGLGEAVADKKVLESAQAEMAAIAGQKPVVTVARKSVAGFKIREGYPIGCKVTFQSLFLVSVTSVVLTRNHLTVKATIAWAYVSKSSSLKSISIKWIKCAVWI
jgi:ribosomal protein L5